MKVQKNADKTVDLLADAAFDQVDHFKVSGQMVSFNVKGQAASLRPKPPLLGLQTADSLKKYKSDYAFKADEYKTDPALVAKLKAESRNVRVRVYFGTWCSVCSRMVPKILKLASELKGSKIAFEYYGLPQPMSDDPMTAKENLNGVPTASSSTSMVRNSDVPMAIPSASRKSAFRSCWPERSSDVAGRGASCWRIPGHSRSEEGHGACRRGLCLVRSPLSRASSRRRTRRLLRALCRPKLGCRSQSRLPRQRAGKIRKPFPLSPFVTASE